MPDTTFRAELIATLITANCEAYHNRAVSHAKWSAEQNRLWKLAANRAVASKVLALVCPTLAVGR